VPIRLHIDHDVPLAIADRLGALQHDGAPKYEIERQLASG
jgi:hypothetical protein